MTNLKYLFILGLIFLFGQCKSLRNSKNRPNWVKSQSKAGWSLILPADWVGTCSDHETVPRITIDNDTCDLWKYEMTNQLIEIVDAYYTIKRTYHIINWCTYQAGQKPVKIRRIERAHGMRQVDYF